MHNKKILDWESPVAYVGIVIFAGGLGVFIYEIVMYLIKGYWKGISILSPLYEKWDWAVSPDSWIGLHEILDGTPLWVGLIIFSWILLYLGKGLD